MENIRDRDLWNISHLSDKGNVPAHVNLEKVIHFLDAENHKPVIPRLLRREDKRCRALKPKNRTWAYYTIGRF